ncbi:hypothetical protein QBC34DRAFT_100512 [Podospora aff. communis PSN243]|uniref:NACHT-NTPase and P-loop NTPases N-terminal domain-containing protein n=1 Tax=Podospora aff. communis PSN243 TaxID=3040156 RepID=A0AAV9GMD1_9PEZI|nr:hypothetical protein QBC34DRAFT_100512 [Podospora aff. communis PSN243]
MAEAIALVALAGNVLQFLESGGKFASKAFEICRHAPNTQDGPSNLKRLRQTSTDLQGLLEKLHVPTPQTSGESARRSPSRDLAPLVSECSAVIQEVLDKLSRIDINSNFKRTNLILAEFKATWHRRDIQDLENRLIGLREHMRF